MSAVFAILGSYLIGSIPCGYLMAKWIKGVDIREHGSGNPGATNVYRVVGKSAGIATLGLDILKGLVPVLVVRRILPEEIGTAAFCGLAAVAGHNWSPFLNFKGGKGVATSAGVFLALLPIPTIAALFVFSLVAGWSKHISIGSLAAAVTLPLAALLMSRTPLFYKIAAIIVGTTVIVKHLPNIKRLKEGQEPRFSFYDDEKKD